MNFGITKYLLIAGGVLFLIMGTTIYIMSSKLDTANAKLGQYEERMSTFENAIRDQKKAIDDMIVQTEIINKHLSILGDDIQRIEEESIQRIRDTEDILEELTTLESEEAAKRLSDNLNSILNKMEGASR